MLLCYITPTFIILQIILKPSPTFLDYLAMRLKIRGPTGASALTLGDSATVADLKQEITKATSLTNFAIKYSYPPRIVNLPSDGTLLKDIDIKLNGQTLIISDSGSRGSSRTPTPPSAAPHEVAELIKSISVPKFAGMNQDHGILPEKPKTKTGRTYEDPKPIPLQKKDLAKDTPELPLPDRGATLGKLLTLAI